MQKDWQISAGYLSELLLPAAFALAAVLSALVLADARRRLRPGASLLWTLLALALPHVAVPLYLAERILSRPKRGAEPAVPQPAVPQETPQPAAAPEAPPGEPAPSPAPPKRTRRGLLLPLAYATALLAATALYFHFDYRSADARFARARSASLFGRRDDAIREYRAALAAGDDAHTRKLLGKELYLGGRFEEALAEFRAAREEGEPDYLLGFYAALSLDALGRAEEAAPLYVELLGGPACGGEDERGACATARSRLQAAGRAAP